MGNVCSTCIHDDAKSARIRDSFHVPLVASDREAGAAGSRAELEAHNAALDRIRGPNTEQRLKMVCRKPIF